MGSRSEAEGSLITGATRIVGIFGDPVEHSRSPAMHNAAFRALGLDYAYVAFHVLPGGLRRAVAGARALDLHGWNVTVPHKERILPLLDESTGTARAIGAVNTVYRKGDRMVGDNTDAEGFTRTLRTFDVEPKGLACMLIGAGGSARAVAFALASNRVKRLLILNRSRRRASALAEAMPRRRGLEVTVGRLDAASDPRVLGAIELVVNTTSLGLDGRSMPPLDVSATSPDCFVYDLVYGAKPTPLVGKAREAGRRAEDGRRMLLEQAGLAFQLWTGKPPPIEVMANALKN